MISEGIEVKLLHANFAKWLKILKKFVGCLTILWSWRLMGYLVRLNLLNIRSKIWTQFEIKIFSVFCWFSRYRMIWYPNKQKQSPGTVLLKKVFWKISQNLHGNTFVRVSFLIKLQAAAIKKGSPAGAFLWVLQNFQEQLFYRQMKNNWIKDIKQGWIFQNLKSMWNHKDHHSLSIN